MSFETAQKFKKFFKLIILGILSLSVLLMCAIVFLIFFGGSAMNGLRSSNYGGDPVGMYGKGIPGGYITEQAMILPSTDSVPPPIFVDNSVSNGTTSSGAGETPIVERKLMQDGNLSLVVKKAEDSVNSLAVIVTNLGGRIDSVNYQNTEGFDKKTATVVLRVPSANFGSAMNSIKASAIKVTSENISTRDVTEQFIDMQARLKTLKATEEQYLEIMKKSVKIDDILTVSRYLSDVRTQIEQVQGQMNYFSRQVDMSIITVYLTSEPEINPASVIWNPKTTALDAMRNFMQTIFLWGNIIIMLVLYYLPIFILLGGIAYLVFFFYVKVLRPWYDASKDLFHF